MKMLTLPAIRFVRVFDAREYRMLNIWMRVTTLDHLANAPLATELTVTAQTIEEAMIKIREAVMSWKHDCWQEETIADIEKASKQLVEAKDSVYEVR